ncbi:MAG: hypothetical protein AB1422_01855 [bacterium]
MSRIVKKIEIEGKEVMALFDTGAMHTYVCNEIVGSAPTIIIPEPYKVAFDGRIIEVKKLCLLWGKIEGRGLDMEAVPIDDIGRINGNKIDVVIGALTMEKWEIIPNPKDGTLDLTGLKRREFIEF